jgi:hypothetical protein
MKLFFRLGCFAIVGLMFILPNQAMAGKNTFKFFEDMEIHGFVSSSYSYNFNKPQSQTNCGLTGSCIRIFDTDDNTFKLDNTELVFLKDTPDIGDIGYRFDLTFGFSLPEVAQRARSSAVSGQSETVSSWILVSSSPMSVPKCLKATTAGT